MVPSSSVFCNLSHKQLAQTSNIQHQNKPCDLLNRPEKSSDVSGLAVVRPLKK